MAFIEPCFGIGHNLSQICQMTSEDIKHQLIIINNTTFQCHWRVKILVIIRVLGLVQFPRQLRLKPTVGKKTSFIINNKNKKTYVTSVYKSLNAHPASFFCLWVQCWIDSSLIAVLMVSSYLPKYACRDKTIVALLSRQTRFCRTKYLLQQKFCKHTFVTTKAVLSQQK